MPLEEGPLATERAANVDPRVGRPPRHDVGVDGAPPTGDGRGQRGLGHGGGAVLPQEGTKPVDPHTAQVACSALPMALAALSAGPALRLIV